MTSKFSPSLKIKSNLGQSILHGTDAFDIEQLYCLTGLLILEGRVPVQSENGRKPGPHAHYAYNNNFKNHTCDPKNVCCIMAQHYRDRLTEPARRNQMVSIEVWLLPECGHYDNFLRGTHETKSVTDFMHLDCPMQDSFLLIEEWIIKMIPKRNFQGPIQTVTSLLKTITSYLHSSILSNELFESQGRAPRNIYYKISCLQNIEQTNQESNNHLYKSLSFPSIGAGESNILTISVRAMNDPSRMKSISCDICLFDSKIALNISNDQEAQNLNNVKSMAQMTRLKLSSSSSAFSVTGMSKREKSISESQDKRRGFTLPLNSTKYKQQLTSPMVVCTDQNSKPPPSLFLHNFPCKKSVKDSTPFPKFKTNQEMMSSFIHNDKIDSGPQINSFTSFKKTRLKSENRIIFTDSSSSESIDKNCNQLILPLSTEQESLRFFADVSNPRPTTSFKYTNTQPLSRFGTFKDHSERFNRKSGLPLKSSPVPSKKYLSSNFHCNMTASVEIRHSKNNALLSRLAVTPGVELEKNSSYSTDLYLDRNSSSSAPVVSSQKLLINFEESMLNMRIHPVGIINGFEIELGASGNFNPKHVRLPLTTYFFQLSDDNAPSPYLGFVDLQTLCNKRGYQVPRKGSIQLTLFNPNGSVIKMFVVLYNLCDMPPNHQTFLRQRTIYMPIQQNSTIEHSCNNDNIWSYWTVGGNSTNSSCDYHSPVNLPSYLRYLVHLKLHTSKTGKLYLHTDIRLIFSRDKFEFDPNVATYELRSFVDPPPEPRYSPKN